MERVTEILTLIEEQFQFLSKELDVPIHTAKKIYYEREIPGVLLYKKKKSYSKLPIFPFVDRGEL